MKEIWKPIKGYESLYEISNLGNVRSLVTNRNLKPIHSKNGYYTVGLSKNGNVKLMTIHRLVALHFVTNPNPNEFNIVNHKDENKLNNVYTNLEWCTLSYNFSYGTAQQRANAKKRNLFNTKHSKPIEGYDDEGNVIYSFSSLMEGHRNGFDFRLVSACCLGKRSFHKGLHWRFTNV